jgi:hypothetical protein
MLCSSSMERTAISKQIRDEDDTPCSGPSVQVQTLFSFLLGRRGCPNPRDSLNILGDGDVGAAVHHRTEGHRAASSTSTRPFAETKFTTPIRHDQFHLKKKGDHGPASMHDSISVDDRSLTSERLRTCLRRQHGVVPFRTSRGSWPSREGLVKRRRPAGEDDDLELARNLKL